MGKNKGKQFNLEKRRLLERMVAKGREAKEVGEALGMDPTSVSRELARNAPKSGKPNPAAPYAKDVRAKRAPQGQDRRQRARPTWGGSKEGTLTFAKVSDAEIAFPSFSSMLACRAALPMLIS